jgi:hypothetical protein
MVLEPNTRYHQITFGGCGFLLPFHFGVVLALMDNDIDAQHTVGISGGAMAALAMLRGCDLYVGIRQATIDMIWECCGFLCCGMNVFLMNYYFKYMWHYRCLFRDSQAPKDERYHMHDMSQASRLSASELTGRYHALLVSIHVPQSLKDDSNVLVRRMSRAIDNSFIELNAVIEWMVTTYPQLDAFLKLAVVNRFENDKDLVVAACLAGGIPALTTFWPRHCRSASVSRHAKVRCRYSIGPTDLSAAGDDTTNLPAGQRIHSTARIVVSPCDVEAANSLADGNASAHKIFGDFPDCFPIFSPQTRKDAFVKGYRETQKQIRNCKLLKLRPPAPAAAAAAAGAAAAVGAGAGVGAGTGTGASADSVGLCDDEQTVAELLDFILGQSYAREWKNGRFSSLVVDGQRLTEKDFSENPAFVGCKRAIHGGSILALAALVGMALVITVSASACTPALLYTVVCVLFISAAWLVHHVLSLLKQACAA